MKRMMVSMLATATLLSACVASDPVSRSANTSALPSRAVVEDVAGPKVMVAQYDVKAVKVSVPKQLRVSEANLFYPVADIVWRGEPLGDRHMQVRRIFEEAAAKATARMTKGRAAVVEIEVTRFHSVTEKTRYTIGGTHSLHFNLVVRDATTGVVLDGPRKINADVKAAGGAQAVAEEQMGRTQRIVILERLEQVLRRELSAQTHDPMLVGRALGEPAAVATQTVY